MKKEVLVSLHNFIQILVADRPLPRHILFLQPLLEHIRRGLQVDDEVRRRYLLAEVVVVAIVGIKLLVGEIQTGKELVFLENVVRNHGLLRPRP